jgi:uncharacterized protein
MHEAHGTDDGRSGPPGSGRRRLGGRGRVAVVALVAVVLAGAGTAAGLALTAGAATPAPVPSGCGSSAPRLTVQGTGQASAPPDVLTAVFGFSTTADASTAALSDNNAEVNQALLALAGNEVAKRDVQTTGLTLQAQYAYPKGVPTLTGYQVVNTVTATLRNAKTAGAAIDAVVNATGNAAQINSLTFSFSDPARVEDEARADAVRQAVTHATTMADAAGRRLGPVCSLTDNTQPPTFGQQLAAGASFSSNAPSSSVPVEPGSQVQTDQVTIVYALVAR